MDRGEAMDQLRLESYSRALIDLNDDVNAFEFIEWYGSQPRTEFEPIIPAKADFVAFVKRHGKRKDWAVIRAERKERAAAEEREIQEHLAQRRRDGEAGNPVDEMIASAAPKRSVLTGWTIAELRAAADALEKGKAAFVPDPSDLTFEQREARRREFMKMAGVTSDEVEAIRRRMAGLIETYQVTEAGSVEVRRG